MSEMLTKVATALEQAFKDRVAASASTPGKPVTFAETSVTAPGFDVWEAYARAAVEAMPPTASGVKNNGSAAVQVNGRLLEPGDELVFTKK